MNVDPLRDHRDRLVRHHQWERHGFRYRSPSGRAGIVSRKYPEIICKCALDGVDTLELDIGITRDEVIVVSHERGLNPDLARNAQGVYVAPPGIPFIQLPLADVKKYAVGQIRSGSAYAAQFPDQRAIPDARISTLAEVLDLVRRSGDVHVGLNIETKIDPDHQDKFPDPERFVTLLLNFLHAEKVGDRVMVQSFDWRTLQLVQRSAPAIPTVYLTLQAGSIPTVSLDKASRWTAGFDPAEHGKSLPRTIKAAGGAIWSPFLRCRCRADIRIPQASIFRSGLDRKQGRRHGANDRAGRGRNYLGQSRSVTRVAGEKGVALPKGSPVTP